MILCTKPAKFMNPSIASSQLLPSSSLADIAKDADFSPQKRQFSAG
jgi:hypothetical protein